MLTGRLPFVGTYQEVMAAHITQPPPDPRTLRPDCSSGIADAVQRALSKNREDRFATAEEFACTVTEALRGRFEVPTRPPAPAPPPVPELEKQA
jgi:serine/threonine-protein kinase